MNRATVGVLPHAFLLQFAAYMIRPTAAYQAIELDVAPAAVGLVAASFAILPLILAVSAGRWIDAGRGNTALIAGSILMVAGGVGLLVVPASLWSLLLWNAVIGLGHLLSVLGEQNVVAQAGTAQMDRAFGRYTFIASAGQAAAPAALAVLGGNAVIPDTRTLVLAYLITCIVLVGVSLTIRPSTLGSATQDRPQGLRDALRLPRAGARVMFGGMVASMFVLAAIDLVQVYLPALGVERGLPVWVVGALLSARAVATMISRLGLSWLSARIGRGALIAISTGIGAVAVGLLAIPSNAWVLGVLLVIAGLTLGIGQPLSMSVISLAAPRGTLATWLAIRLSCNRLGQSAVPAALSVLALGSGTGAVFLVTGAMLALTAATAGVTLRGDGTAPEEP